MITTKIFLAIREAQRASLRFITVGALFPLRLNLLPSKR
jgi:hypothetical protein